MSTVKQNVMALLEKYPNLRDSDKKLEWSYWIKYDGLMKENKQQITWEEYSKATPGGSIRRARRALQEEFEHLRGTEWVSMLRRAKESTKGGFINYKANHTFVESDTVEDISQATKNLNKQKDYADLIEQIRLDSIYRPNPSRKVEKTDKGTYITNGEVSDIN